MNLMNNGQMDRGNENPTQHLKLYRYNFLFNKFRKLYC